MDIVGRIVIIPFLNGKLAADGTFVEPDINAILEKWLERHPEHRGREFHIIKTGGQGSCQVRVTVDECPELANYKPADDAALYERYLAKSDGPPPHKIWIEQCEAAKGIEDELGTDKALKYLVEEKFINFLEAADENAAFRDEIPAFVAEIKTIFEPWQLRECLDKARETEPFDPTLFEPMWSPLLGLEPVEYDAEEVEDMRQDDIRECARDLLLVERAREWLLEEGS
jgi:hypothetical protein